MKTTNDYHKQAIAEVARKFGINEVEVEWFQVANFYADLLRNIETIKEKSKKVKCKEKRTICSIRDNYDCVGCALKKSNPPLNLP